jgi:hypothetical protein
LGKCKFSRLKVGDTPAEFEIKDGSMTPQLAHRPNRRRFPRTNLSKNQTTTTCDGLGLLELDAAGPLSVVDQSHSNVMFTTIGQTISKLSRVPCQSAVPFRGDATSQSEDGR